jgi:hypothetical protein
MAIEIREVAVLCPECRIPLVFIPKPIADDLVVCPRCASGGSYEEVVEKRGNLLAGRLPIGHLKELLRKAGFPSE